MVWYSNFSKYFWCFFLKFKAQRKDQDEISVCAVSVCPQGGTDDVFSPETSVNQKKTKRPCLWASIDRFCLFICFPLSLFLKLFLSAHRASRSSYKHCDYQHRPKIHHPAVQTRLWWQNIHFPLAGGGPGELAINNWSARLLHHVVLLLGWSSD